jgi:S-formylglutathione hydrolase FrmB
MDSFAATHAGLAPIVVVPDATGTPLANPMCLNSALGQVETYLADDVPNWLRANLQLDSEPRHWAIGGFSYGGTCSLQLAVRRPQEFPTFLDISGQREPTLGNRQRTVRAAFGGDFNQFRAANPLDILAHAHQPSIAGIIAVGTHDDEYGPQARDVYNATRAAGIPTQLLKFPGNHSWTIATAALRAALPWLAARANLMPP